MRTFLILPGYGDSGPSHWQTLWEKDPAFKRVRQRDWEHPDRREWVETLEKAVAAEQETILVAHSLASLLVAHWAATSAPATRARVTAALLVAPPDPAAPVFPSAAIGFAPLPMEPLPFRSLLVSSSDDPYAAPEFARRCAAAWGSRHFEAGALGHINAQSRLGAWEEGLRLLQSLL